MKLSFHIYHHSSPSDRAVLAKLVKEVQNMATAIEQLTASTNSLEQIVNNIVVIIGEVKDALDEARANNDMTAVQAATAKLNVMRDALVAAGLAADITPETPVEPTPVPTPVPAEPPVA